MPPRPKVHFGSRIIYSESTLRSIYSAKPSAKTAGKATLNSAGVRGSGRGGGEGRRTRNRKWAREARVPEGFTGDNGGI